MWQQQILGLGGDDDLGPPWLLRFALMTECGLEKTDMQTLFNAMDIDGSGEVDYVEFCAELGASNALRNSRWCP